MKLSTAAKQLIGYSAVCYATESKRRQMQQKEATRALLQRDEAVIEALSDYESIEQADNDATRDLVELSQRKFGLKVDLKAAKESIRESACLCERTAAESTYDQIKSEFDSIKKRQEFLKFFDHVRGVSLGIASTRLRLSTEEANKAQQSLDNINKRSQFFRPGMNIFSQIDEGIRMIKTRL